MIDPLYIRTNAVMPTVYENSLSYYEVLCKIAYKLNEVIEQVNALTGGDVQPIQPAHPQEQERATKHTQETTTSAHPQETTTSAHPQERATKHTQETTTSAHPQERATN